MSFRHWPLFAHLVSSYWNETDGWTPPGEWETADLLRLDAFVTTELQRRGESVERTATRKLH